jgi:hypothetical protein
VSSHEVLVSILNALGEIVDLVESPPHHSSIKFDKGQKRAFCNAVVDGANGFSKQFNAAVAKTEKSSSLDTRGLYADSASKYPCAKQ